MHTAIWLKADGSIEPIAVNQSKAHLLFDNDIEICGAIDICDAVAVSRKSKREYDIINPFSVSHPHYFECDCFGDVLLVGSDQNGDPCDVDICQISLVFGRRCGTAYSTL